MCKFASCFPPCKPHPYRPCQTRRATESGRAYTEASHKHSLGRENGATRSICRYSDEDLPYSWEILFLLCIRRYYEMGPHLIKHYNLKWVLLVTVPQTVLDDAAAFVTIPRMVPAPALSIAWRGMG